MNVLVYSIALTMIFCFLAMQIEGQNILDTVSIRVNNHIDWTNELNKQGILLNKRVTLAPMQHGAERSLLRQHPALINSITHLPLGSFPTPIEQRQELRSTLSVGSLYIKRDDLSGSLDPSGTHNYGGNKVRKLEFLLADACAHNASTVITFGAAGSNHALATSVYCKQLGLKCMCMLKPEANSHDVRNNLLLHTVVGSELHYFPDNKTRKVGTVAAWLDHKNTYGTYPYIIPSGGSNPLGALGYVNAAFELKDQINANLIPEPDYIYLPCGSKGTASGLILGCALAGLHSHVIAVAIEPEEYPDEFNIEIKSMIKRASTLLSAADSSIPRVSAEQCTYSVVLDHAGPTYAVFTEEGVKAMHLVKNTTDIRLDGVYSGKAFSAVVSDSTAGKLKDKTVLFWNTYCGLDMSKKIQNSSYDKLPVCFHEYFTQPVQELDR